MRCGVPYRGPDGVRSPTSQSSPVRDEPCPELPEFNFNVRYKAASLALHHLEIAVVCLARDTGAKEIDLVCFNTILRDNPVPAFLEPQKYHEVVLICMTRRIGSGSEKSSKITISVEISLLRFFSFFGSSFH